MIIITKRKSHNNYCSVGVMELCLLNLLIMIDCFLCISYLCVLFESLSHVINQEWHVYSWNLRKIYLVQFLKFWNVSRFTRKISKFLKRELGKFIPNFPLKHVITTTISTKLNVISNFACFWQLLSTFNFWREDWALGCVSTHIWHFAAMFRVSNVCKLHKHYQYHVQFHV